MRQFAGDPREAFPGNGQMKPEQLEIERLRREIVKLKAERDILKNCPGLGPPVRGRNGLWYGGGRRVAADSLLVA
jgi:transposase